MLKARNITKSFGDLQVLNDVKLEIEKGEMVSIIGKSGSGKSTLLHILGTLDKPDAGYIEIAGSNVLELNNKELAKFRNQKMGFVFQFHHLLAEFTAIENTMIPSLINGDTEEVSRAKALELISYLGLSQRTHHKPSQLSGGEQQRIAIARALINKPDIIFADEPTGNLDSHNSQELHELFLQLKTDFKQTFVIVTHNKELAKICDRTFKMELGKINKEV